jgi:FHA domain
MKLDIESGGKRWQIGLPEGSLFIKVGSAADSDVQIADASPMHAKFENFMGKWTVTDQMSDTGTKLNGEPAYSAELKPGDVVEIGSAKIRILAGEGGLPRKVQQATVPAVPMEAPPGLAFKTDSLQEMISKAEPVTLREATPQEFAAALELEGRARQRREASPPREKSPQERFAEEMAQRESRSASQQVTRQAPVYQMRASQNKKGSPVIGFIIMGAIVLCIGGAVISSILDELGGEPPAWANSEDPFADITPGRSGVPQPEARPGETPSKSRPASRRLTSNEEKSYRDRISKIENSKDDLETRLAAMDVIIEELKEKPHGLSWDLERARRNLDIALMTEMSRRYNDDSSAIYDLLRSKDYEAAFKRLEALRSYSRKSDYHKAHLVVTGLADYIDPKFQEIEALNAAYITEEFIAADQFRSLRDFKSASETVKRLLAKARVESLMKSCALHEVAELGTWALEQEAGKREAPRAPFDKKKWKLPAAPKSDLMPEGESGRWRFTSALTNKLSKAARAGELEGVVTVYHGREALVGKWVSYRLTLEIRRPMPDDTGETHNFSFSVLRQPSELPAATQLALFEQFKEPTRDEYLGMLLYCYDNGLMEDAPRLAWKLWKADPSVKADLDKLMAAKLGIEVPAGGFIEKDGKLVEK